MAKKKTFIQDYLFEELVNTWSIEEAQMLYDVLYKGKKRGGFELEWYAEKLGAATVPLELLREERGSRTRKFLFGLHDRYAIETVIIRRRKGYTGCISSQVGCAVGCQFCASGQAGFKRNLTPGEIVQQVVSLEKTVNRLVFMGMGEPLHNYDNVLKAIRILRDRRGLGFQTSGITISTIGIPKGLKKLREEHVKLNLTVSLHATHQATRNQLMPGARAYRLHEIIERSQSWAERHNRPVTYAYLVLPGINTHHSDMKNLKRWFGQNAFARVNLLRRNPAEGFDFVRASDHVLTKFKRRLRDAGVDVVVRDTQGRDISAACGQLWLKDARTQHAIRGKTAKKRIHS